MQEIKQFFINIERTDINESMENLVSEDFIDSIDIMALVAEIEKFYKVALQIEVSFFDFDL
ncbi:acyl carrier protein [Campylobacter coli]|nr:acyl carrier protein [Campylobacter coli]